MRSDNGGPAFPVECCWTESGVSGKQTSNSTAFHVDMSLRDYFAAKALQGILCHEGIETTARSQITDATWAYEYADAMMKARETHNAP